MRPPLAAAMVVKKFGVLGGALHHGARAEAHAERAPGFADGNFETENA